MSNKFKAINNLKDSFEFNLDDVSSSKFETTRSLFSNFTSAFNVKALAIAAMMGLSVGAVAAEQTPLTAIQETFNQSIKMVNSHYNENLPTYFESKGSIKDDTTFKNEFWQGSVATLIVGDVNDAAAPNKYREQVSLMGATSGNAIYVSEFAENPLSVRKPPTPTEYYNNVSDYKHYFRNDNTSPVLVDLKSKFKPENQMYFDDFITYHEMAHGSFEQENARINDKATLNLNTVSQLESHSDVSSLFMIANKYALNYKQFKSLTSDLIEGRSIYAGIGRDFNHNTAVVLSELLHTLDNNENIYKNMSTEKISAFSAYFVHEFFNQDPKKLFTKLESEHIPTSINQFLKGFEEYRDVLKKVQSENGFILDQPKMGGGPFYMYMVEDIYFTRNPDKFEAFNAASAGGYITKAAGIKMAAVQSFMDQSESEKAIYAVEAHKFMKNLTVDTYSNYLSSYYNPSAITKIHDQSVLSEVFKNNKAEINKEISAERVIKNKL
jgi:hypothetical protein